MDFDPLTLFFATVAAAAGWFALQRVWSKRWPTIEAKVIEVDAQSPFEREGRGLYLNLDSDHLLVYTVAGKDYQHMLEDNANVRVMGLKIARQTPRTGPKEIRYNPRNPKSYVNPKFDAPIFVYGGFGLSFTALALLILRQL